MLFTYQARTTDGRPADGTIDAATIDSAITALQRRGLILVSIEPEAKKGFLGRKFVLFSHVPLNDVVIFSRQLATLFEAKVPVLDSFKLLAAEAENGILQETLTQMIDDIQAGVPISGAMGKHPKVFSAFYVNMVRSGEESGKLSEALGYLADHLERSYELVTKVKNALIYPAFVVLSFVGVLIVMFVVVIPQLTTILKETGQELPLITRLLIGLSEFLVNYGAVLLVALIIGVFALWRYAKVEGGKKFMSRVRLSTPYVGALYRRLYLSRIADNMDTMLTSGISMVRAIEITSDVVGDETYRSILLESMEGVRSGASFSDTLSRHAEIPQILVQMSKIGEETGKLGYVLKTVARFYKREVNSAVDNLVSLIEPLMIVFLGLGVGVLLVAVLGPIYNISAGF